MNLNIIPTALVGALLLSISAVSCSAQRTDPRSDHPSDVTTLPVSLDKANDEISHSRQNAITRAVAKSSPAVVGISVTELQQRQYNPYGDVFDDPFFEQFFRNRPGAGTYQEEVHGLGSGFIISADGYIVTNDHVAGSASKVIVTTTDGKKFDAKIIGSDRTSDVALLKIEATNLPFLELGNSDDVIIGEWAIAFGNPFGLFNINTKPTVTVGVISNTDVNLQPQEERVYRGMIQTDAAISSGNSGGPLMNALGQVVGINATIYSTSQSRMGAGSIGIGFAIPINRARRVIDELRTVGSVDRDYWTGMTIQQVTPKIARYLQLSTTEGVVVVDVTASSPAMKAGLQQGDVIIEINGAAIKTESNAAFYIYDARVGDVLKMKYIRSGKEMTSEMTLERRRNR